MILTMPIPILDSLARRPSRASVAAIGHRFILDGSTPGSQIRGLDALCNMACDWSVAILEETINDPALRYPVRRYALVKLQELTERAIETGYSGLNKKACRRLVRRALVELGQHTHTHAAGEIPAVEDLCDHLSQAVADGAFPTLPDF